MKTINENLIESFQGLIELCQPVLVGPSTPLSPIMYNYGIDVLSGTIVIDPQAVITGKGSAANRRTVSGKGHTARHQNFSIIPWQGIRNRSLC